MQPAAIMREHMLDAWACSCAEKGTAAQHMLFPHNDELLCGHHSSAGGQAGGQHKLEGGEGEEESHHDAQSGVQVARVD